MNKWIIVIWLLFPVNLMFCQSSYQIADSSKAWNNLGGNGIPIVCNVFTSNIRFSGDTLINSLHYLKVWESEDSLQQNWSLAGCIYEDPISNEVFFRNNLDVEGMIYDFSLSISDTIIIYNTYLNFPYSVPLVCYQIDSIMIDNEYRQRYFLSWAPLPIPEEDDIWIEGIGSVHGILNSAYLVPGGFPGFRELLCYSENDTLVFMNPPFNKCYMDEFYPKILSESYDTAYLGSNYEFQIAISDTTPNDSITWKASLIPPNFWFDTVNGIIHGNPLETGSFRCKVILTNWIYYVDLIDTNIVVTFPLATNSYGKTNVKMFPNPTTGIVNVEIYTSNELFLRLHSSYGRLLYESILEKQLTSIDLSKFPSGLYCLSIYDKANNNTEYQVIVKY